MDRLTKTKIDVEKFSNKTKSRLTHEYFEMAKLNNKLCEYEDFMENFDFDNLEDLEHYVQEIHNHYEEVKNKGTCGLCHYLDNEQLDLLKKENAHLENKLAEKEKEIESLKSKEKKIRLHTKRDWFERCCILEDKSISLGLENIDLKQQLKEERKKVVQNLKDWCDKNFNWVGDGTGYDGQEYNEKIGSNNTINKLREKLDQIERGGNNGNQ